MKYLVVGEFTQAQKSEIGWVANAADQLARAGFPVPYSIVLTKSLFEEFLVDSGAITNFFSLIKKQKYDKAAKLVESTKLPTQIEEELYDLMDSHNIKEFDVHASPNDQEQEYHCYKLRRGHLPNALRACWAAIVKKGKDPFSAVMLTKHIGAKKTGKVYTQHPLNNSRAQCVITVNRPKKGTFFVQTQSKMVINSQQFQQLDSPLLVEEKNQIVSIVQQALGFSARPLIIDWIYGDGTYVLSYKELGTQDRNEFFKSQ